MFFAPQECNHLRTEVSRCKQELTFLNAHSANTLTATSLSLLKVPRNSSTIQKSTKRIKGKLKVCLPPWIGSLHEKSLHQVKLGSPLLSQPVVLTFYCTPTSSWNTALKDCHLPSSVVPAFITEASIIEESCSKLLCSALLALSLATPRQVSQQSSSCPCKHEGVCIKTMFLHSFNCSPVYTLPCNCSIMLSSVVR